MRRLGRVRGFSAVAGCILLTVLVVGCSFGDRSPLPKLESAYGDLAGFWAEAARAVGIGPSEGHLNDWWLSYDTGGKVLGLRLSINVDQGPRKYRRYTLSQSADGKTHLSHSDVDGEFLAGTIPAGPFFDQLSRLGYRSLETHQTITPPIYSWLYVTSGAVNYGNGQPAYVIADGNINNVGPQGLSFHGSHGVFQIDRVSTTSIQEGASTDMSAEMSASTAASLGDSIPVYLIPDVGCFPRDAKANNTVAREWECDHSR